MTMREVERRGCGDLSTVWLWQVVGGGEGRPCPLVPPAQTGQLTPANVVSKCANTVTCTH